MKPYLYIDESMGLPDKGMALGEKVALYNVHGEIRTLVDLGIALEVQLLRLRSHRPLKTSRRIQWSLNGLGAIVTQSAGVTPPPCRGLMWWVNISNDKMGEGHPPPGVVKPKKGWCNLGATIATLPSSKHSLHKPRLSGRRMRPY